MNYKQVKTPVLTIKEKAGLCLQFTQSFFNVPHLYDSAWQAYESTMYKHNDRNFPSGVAVPVWFDWTGAVQWSDGVWRTARYGHAAARTADGKIHSAPGVGYGERIFNNVDELVSYFGNGMKFVGWSEDLSGVRIIKEDDMSVTGLNEARINAFAIGGRNGMGGRPNALKGECDADLKEYHVGKESNADQHAWYNSAEGKSYREKVLPAVYKDRDNLKKQLADTTAKLTQVSTQANLSVSLQKQIDDLTKKNAQLVNDQQAAQATGNAFIQWIGGLFNSKKG